MKKAIGLFFIILSSLLSAEIAVRLFSFIKIDSANFIFDPKVDWRCRPAPPLSNSAGFKDYEHHIDRKEGTFRIAFVGDSFPYGMDYTYEEVYPYLIEKIGREKGTNIESVNFGVIGHGPVQYRKMINSYVKSFTPDLVVLTLYVGNDIYQSDPNYRSQLWLGTVATIPSPNYVDFDKEAILLYTAFRGTFRYIKYKFEYLCENKVKLNDDLRLNLEYQYHSMFQKLVPEKAKRRFENLHNILKKIFEETTGLGSDLLVVLAPAEIQINNDLQSKFLARYSIKPSELNFFQPQEIISDYLQRLGINYIDLLQRFIEEKDTKLLYQGDAHFNRMGNYIAAVEMFRAVEKIISKKSDKRID